MQVVILASRSGWHTDQLLTALTERGHVAALARYEELVAAVSGETTITGGAADLSRADLALARIIPTGRWSRSSSGSMRCTRSRSKAFGW